MATTWTSPAAAVDTDRARVAKAACTTQTEVPALATRYADGIDLKGLRAVTPYLEMARATGTITLTGAVTGKKVTVAGVDFVAGTGFDNSGTDNADAAALAAAIASSAAAKAAGILTATAALNVVTVQAAPGTAGNALTLASDDASIVVSGATLAGGTNTAGGNIRGYLLNPATGVMVRCSTFDVAVAAGVGAQGGPAILTNGLVGRLQLLPDTVGGACSVYAVGSPSPSILNR